MILTYGLGGLVLIALLAFLFYKLTKAIIKTVVLVVVALLVISVIFGVLLVRDVNDLRANLPVKDSLMLLEHQGELVAGFEGPFMAEQQPKFISEEQLNQIKTAGFGENYYKVFTMKSEAFDSVQEVNFDDRALSREFIFSVIESDQPIELLISDKLKQEGIAVTPQIMAAAKEDMARQGTKTSTDARNTMFGLLISGGIEEKGPLFILEEFKAGKIEIYPETMAFKMIKLLPINLVGGYLK